MNRSLFGMALAALMGFAQPAAAQHVSVRLRLGDGPVAIRGYYASRPQYVIPRRFVCEPDGAFLYCWDRAAYRVERPVIYVYPTDRRFVVTRRDYRHDEDQQYWRHAAHRVFHGWRHGRGHGHDDDAHVAVVLAWER
jgi:hypothetical protein